MRREHNPIQNDKRMQVDSEYNQFVIAYKGLESYNFMGVPNILAVAALMLVCCLI